MALQAGDTFGRYELVSWLGRGGMAETWRAQLVGDAGVTKPVLIKKVLPEYANDEAFISMFISEARISATLSHGNVAQVFDFGRVEGEYFLAMEFVDGQPLHHALKRAMKSGMSALPIPIAVFIAIEMCRGLHYAHTRTDSSGQPLGIVHRDISPDNVLLGYEGQVKIVDFGIAKAQLIRDIKTEPGVVKGKYLFFSPEQARGEEVDARTDVWATSVVLYELLCGKLPVEGPPQVVMMRVARGEFPSLSESRPDLPEALNRIVLKALHPEQSQRFESSHAFAEALSGFLYANHPRASSLSAAHLLRMLFREDLLAQGRELSVPASFKEELKSWREQEPALAKKPPRPRPLLHTGRIPLPESDMESVEDEAPAALAPATSLRKWALGLSTTGLAIGASCLWLLTSTDVPPEPLGAPRPIERPPTAVQSLSDDARSPTAIAAPSPQATGNAPLTVEPLPASALSLADYQDRIHARVQRGELREAVDLAHQCSTRFPQEGECHLLLGMLYARLNDSRTSVTHYQRFLEYAPATHPSRAKVVQILDDANALSSASGRVAKPETFADMMDVGRTAFRDEKFPEAAATFRNALAMKPGSLDAKLELGLTLIQLMPGTPADHKQAVKLLEDVTHRQSNIRRAWLGLETAYTLTGNKAKARRAHDRYLLMSPRNMANPAKAREMLKNLGR
ncbi:serine/threonine-protein kinase [Corallococcus carmarthensis]|uniref:Serine/threonine-protein kinase n=1 Tax=Corallococcus carmarthensis TaxID=2316728 RepID=A0A3A8K508_9BACT|nr:serine/threonine-protein kinase [Corallococcus carmarthensis]RKH02397.1 serine/threonine-protein kinase [Corallococcus carmarthensis]